MYFPNYNKDSLNKIYNILETYYNSQKEEFRGIPQMEHKLNGHMKAVTEAARQLYPDNQLMHAAAFAHDLGRGAEFKETCGFVGKGAPTMRLDLKFFVS